MDKQYVVLVDYKDKNISWQKNEIILLDPELALPYIGNVIIPLYSAIKSGLYHNDETQKPLVAKIVEELKDKLAPPPTHTPSAPKAPDSNDIVTVTPSKKKLLQNKLQAQILAKKAELAKNKQ